MHVCPMVRKVRGQPQIVALVSLTHRICNPNTYSIQPQSSTQCIMILRTPRYHKALHTHCQAIPRVFLLFQIIEQETLHRQTSLSQSYTRSPCHLQATPLHFRCPLAYPAYGTGMLFKPCYITRSLEQWCHDVCKEHASYSKIHPRAAQDLFRSVR